MLTVSPLDGGLVAVCRTHRPHRGGQDGLSLGLVCIVSTGVRVGGFCDLNDQVACVNRQNSGSLLFASSIQWSVFPPSRIAVSGPSHSMQKGEIIPLLVNAKAASSVTTGWIRVSGGAVSASLIGTTVAGKKMPPWRSLQRQGEGGG